MLWSVSLISSWDPTDTSSYRTSSNTTSVWPFKALPSNLNVRSMLPSAFSGVNVVLAVTSLPSTSRGSFVSFTINLPAILYSLFGIRFVYFTVSTTVTSLSAIEVWEPVSESFAVVLISG